MSEPRPRPRPRRALALLAIVPLALIAVVTLVATPSRPAPTTPTGEYSGSMLGIGIMYTLDVEEVGDQICATTWEKGRTVLVLPHPRTTAARSPARLVMPQGTEVRTGDEIMGHLPVPADAADVVTDAAVPGAGGAMCGGRYYEHAIVV